MLYVVKWHYLVVFGILNVANSKVNYKYYEKENSDEWLIKEWEYYHLHSKIRNTIPCPKSTLHFAYLTHGYVPEKNK